MIVHDVLIVGAGLAGMRAAIAVPSHLNVGIISIAAEGGINAAIHPDDSWQGHMYDTVKGSDWLGDQDAIEILCKSAPEDIMTLEKMGALFSRTAEGHIDQRNFGGLGYPRTCYVADRTWYTCSTNDWLKAPPRSMKNGMSPPSSSKKASAAASLYSICLRGSFRKFAPSPLF